MKFFILSALIASASAIELTEDTWDDVTAGKSVFVKFFAPWCGHCKRMKPAWDSLMQDFEGSDDIIVADVDCVEAGKSLCDKVGVKGFPTIKYGYPDDLQDYQGSRDHPELFKFAETLKPGCMVDTLENCSEEEEDTIAKLKEKSREDLDALVVAEANEREQAQTNFKESVQKLQKEYEQLKQDKESTLEDIKDRYNIGFVKQLIKSSAAEEESQEAEEESQESQEESQDVEEESQVAEEESQEAEEESQEESQEVEEESQVAEEESQEAEEESQEESQEAEESDENKIKPDL